MILINLKMEKKNQIPSNPIFYIFKGKKFLK